MKFHFYFIFFVFLIGCSSNENKAISGKVYVFKSVPDLPKTYNEKIIFEYLAFIDEELFILSYSEEFLHKFVRGKYHAEDSYVYLQFEKTAHDVNYPEIPATSAVDTTEYLPVIMESTWKYPELKMKLSIDKSSIRLDKTGMEQMGEINSEVTLKDFINGIKLQDLEFMLETETIKID